MWLWASVSSLQRRGWTGGLLSPVHSNPGLYASFSRPDWAGNRPPSQAKCSGHLGREDCQPLWEDWNQGPARVEETGDREGGSL